MIEQISKQDFENFVTKGHKKNQETLNLDVKFVKMYEYKFKHKALLIWKKIYKYTSVITS